MILNFGVQQHYMEVQRIDGFYGLIFLKLNNDDMRLISIVLSVPHSEKEYQCIRRISKNRVVEYSELRG